LTEVHAAGNNVSNIHGKHMENAIFLQNKRQQEESSSDEASAAHRGPYDYLSIGELLYHS